MVLELIEDNVFRGMLFAAVGLAFLLYLLSRLARRLKSTGTAKAAVTHVGRRGTRGGVYQPVYEYEAEGAAHRVASRRGYRWPIAGEGELVDLYFIPGRPEKVYVPREVRKSRPLTLFLCIAGVLFFIMGLAVALGYIE